MSATPNQRILVWDAPVRVCHWLTALCFAGAYLTAESERWRLVHVTLGYTMAGLMVFRLVWGFSGTRYARFTQFLRGPVSVLRYLRSLLGQHPEHHVGHNPAGALAIVLMLGCGLFISVSGWASYNDVGGDWLSDWHSRVANAMVLLVLVHLAGVVTASLQHRENLVRAMVTGYKQGALQSGITAAWWWLAGVICVAVCGFWVVQWVTAP